jgi:hypothetical protein
MIAQILQLACLLLAVATTMGAAVRYKRGDIIGATYFMAITAAAMAAVSAVSAIVP